MPNTDSDAVVEHPTWFGQIRNFFTSTDVEHMGRKAIDLGTYKGVVDNAASIYAQTSAGAMPPDPAPKWSQNRVQTFLNWIRDNYPIGTASPTPQPATFAADAAPARLRKELTGLLPAEVEALKAAFAGVMAREPTSPDSYYAIAGIHWYPAIDQNALFHCLHHEHRFLPWHRLHLKRFEDALRTVPGCSEVTLPYWDITTPVPPLLSEKPFDDYVAQAPIGHGYDPLTTSRYSVEEVSQNVASFAIPQQITASQKQSVWELFNRSFWQVHDNGHVSCGSTMANQDIAAFDPIFWFYHCNLDRLWLQWQQAVGATTLAGFKSTCQGPTAWLDVPALSSMPPFDDHAAEAITLSEVAYAAPAKGILPMNFENGTGNAAASRPFRIAGAAALSIRVKDINRANIPGTFVVHLLADGKEVARQAFFQPTDPGVCPNCSQNANVAIDFRVEMAKVADKELTVEIHVPGQQQIGSRFPLSQVGNPTINVRHLVEGS